MRSLQCDSPEKWASEGAYFLGEDSSDASIVNITPSGNTTRQETPWYESAIKTALPVLANVYQQREMTKMNIARMNRGLSPLTGSQYAQFQPPTAQVQFGATADAKKLMLYAAIGVAALVGLRAAKVI